MTDDEKTTADSPSAKKQSEPKAASREQTATPVPSDAAPGSTDPAADAAATAQPQGKADEADVLHGIIDALNSESAALKDSLLRAHAEMDNMRKRTEREKADMAKFAIARFARDIVTVGDTFQRATDAVPTEAAAKDPALQSFLDGVLLAEREFVNTLERHGVRRIDPLGQPFNPHEHEAAGEEEDKDVAAGTVVRVYQPGYMIEDRVLRPAMVVVAKGGPKSAPQPGTSANDNVATSTDAGGEGKKSEA